MPKNSDENPIKRIVFLLDREGDDKDIWEFIKDRNFTNTIKKSLRLLERYEDGEFDKSSNGSEASNEEVNQKLDKLLNSQQNNELNQKLDKVLELLNTEISIKETPIPPKKEKEKLGNEAKDAFSALLSGGLAGK